MVPRKRQRPRRWSGKNVYVDSDRRDRFCEFVRVRADPRIAERIDQRDPFQRPALRNRRLADVIGATNRCTGSQ